ncbi:MAG: DUF3105 domain-containing protein [Polyangiaceae bacterium]|nr:DUF3105 domain-containing protein [Polyangiaceae bacterium]
MILRSHLRALPYVALLAVACSGAEGSGAGAGGGPGTDAAPDVSYEPTPVDGSACNAVMQHHPILASPHVATCSVLDYATNPPSSGPHYPAWPAFKSYDAPVPRGYWVHALEHGAVIVLYSCTDCDDEVAAARQWVDALPLDAVCAKNDSKRRVIISPDPLLPTRWAAAGWGATLRASCFEPAVFADFYERMHGAGPENFCAEGVDLDDGDGGLTVPPGCGTPAGAADGGPDGG